MTLKNVLPKIFSLSIALMMIACNPPRTLYLSNKTKQAITLIVDAEGMSEKRSQEYIFKDSLQGKRIESGHRIIDFGKGKWTKNDIKSLQTVLSKTSIRLDGKQEKYKLPKDMRIGHYSLVVEELVIKIREVKK